MTGTVIQTVPVFLFVVFIFLIEFVQIAEVSDSGVLRSFGSDLGVRPLLRNRLIPRRFMEEQVDRSLFELSDKQFILLGAVLLQRLHRKDCAYDGNEQFDERCKYAHVINQK